MTLPKSRKIDCLGRRGIITVEKRSVVSVWTLVPLIGILVWVPAAGSSNEADLQAEVLLIEERLAEHPDDVEEMIRAGNLYYDMKEWERAKAWYTRSLDFDPANPNVLTDLGTVHRNLEQYDASILAFNAALAIAPHHWQALYNKASVLGRDLGRTEEALVLVEAIEALKEENADIPDLTSLRASLQPKAKTKGPTQKRHDVFRLIELSGSVEVADIVMRNLVKTARTTYPGVPKEFWNEFLRSFDVRDFIGLVAPIYDKYLTHQDVLEMIAFYESPVGQKFVRLQPVMTQELMEVGQDWGEAMGQEIFESLSAAGHLPPTES